MIADLKADSERWEAERRQFAQRSQPSNGTYLFSRSDGIVQKSNRPIVEYQHIKRGNIMGLQKLRTRSQHVGC